MLRRRASNFFTRKSHSVENYNLTKLRSSTQINSLYGGDTHLAVRSTGCLLDIQDSVLTKKTGTSQELTESNKPPIRTRYLGHVTGYQPIRHQYFLVQTVPGLLDVLFEQTVVWFSSDISLTRYDVLLRWNTLIRIYQSNEKILSFCSCFPVTLLEAVFGGKIR